MATENVLETLERIEAGINRVERTLYGDPPARPNGLMVEFEGLRCDVQGLRDDVRRLQFRRPNIAMWIMGYVLFLASGWFAIDAFVNMPIDGGLWDLSPTIGLVLAALLAAVALALLLIGFGWLDGRA